MFHRILAVLAGVALLVTIGAQPASAAFQKNCADVYVFATRGAGVAKNTDSALTGFGATLTEQYKKVKWALKSNGLTVKPMANTYAAGGNGWLRALKENGGQLPPEVRDAYESRLLDGTQTALTQLSKRAAACPFSRFVLMGSDQGAVISDMVLLQADRNLLYKVIAVIGYGSPVFDPGTDEYDKLGSYSDSRYGTTGKIHTIGLPMGYSGERLQICNANDVTCQNRTLEGALAKPLSIKVHKQSYASAKVGAWVKSHLVPVYLY